MKKRVKMLASVTALAILCGTYYGVKSFTEKQEQEENSEENTAIDVFSVAVNEVKSLTFMIEQKEVTFAQKDNVWEKQDEPDFPVSQDKLNDTCGSLDNITADRKLESVEDLSQYGLDNPSNTITVNYGDDEKKVLRIGDKNESTSQYYVSMDEDYNTVYLVTSSVAEPFMNSLYDYAQAETFPVIDSSSVKKVEVQTKDKEYCLEKNEDDATWEISGDTGTEKADSAAASSIASSLSGLAYDKFVNYNAEDLSEYGLNKPYATITVNYEEEQETEIDDSQSTDDLQTIDETETDNQQDADEEESGDQQNADEKESDDQQNEDEKESDDQQDADEKESDNGQNIDGEKNGDQQDADETETDSDADTNIIEKQLVINIGDEAENDMRYINVDDSKKIYTISKDKLTTFLDKSENDFWDLTVNYLSLNNLESLDVSFDGDEKEINVSRETSSEAEEDVTEETDNTDSGKKDSDNANSDATNSDDMDSDNNEEIVTYLMDGRELDETKFVTFYNKMINLSGQKRLTEEWKPSSEKLEMTVAFKDINGEKTEVKYYVYDTNYYAVIKGDKVFLVNKMTIKEMFTAYENLINEENS